MVHRGEAVELAVHVVSDRRDAIPDAVVRGMIRATDSSGQTVDAHTQEWTGI